MSVGNGWLWRIVLSLVLLLSSGYVLAAEKIGGDFSLTDHHGDTFELQQLRGKVVLLFFGYTWCPTVCPDSLAQMAQVLRELDQWADEVDVVFISVDPERDTAAQLAKYVPYFNPNMIGLTGSAADIAQVVKQYRASYTLQKESPQDQHYTIDHTADIYVLNRRGEVVSIIPFGMPAQHIVNVVQQMLSEDNSTTVAQDAGQQTAPAKRPLATTAAQATDKALLPVFNGELQPPLQAFRAKDLQDRIHSLRAYQGKPLLINFWASWCPPCREELPALNRAAAALQAKGIATLAVNVGDSQTAVSEFLRDYPIEFPLLLDAAGESMAAWGIKGMPTTVLVRADGEIAFHVAGERDWDSAEVLARIRELSEVR